jgi:cytochrome P450
VLYQTRLHPLAPYPGPSLAKLSNLYSVVHAFRSDRHEELYRLHQRYGRIVRIGPQRVSILDVQALQSIYGFQANVQKAEWYSRFFGLSIFNAVDRKVHARKRRVMSQAFSDQALRGMEPHILSAIREWCAALGDGLGQKRPGWSQPKHMAHWSACAIFDALGEIFFGKTFGTSVSGANHFWFPLMSLNVRIIDICGQMPLLRHFGLEKYLRMGTIANRNRQVAFSQQQLAARLADTSTRRRDIIYYLQKARDPETGEAYSQQELISEVVLLLGAGTFVLCCPERYAPT